jgi:hypothetical protein
MFIDTFPEFTERQASAHIFIDGRNVSLFENGAIWHHDTKYGEESPGPHEATKRCVEYHQALVAKIQVDVSLVANSIAEQLNMARSGHGPLPSDEAVECLKHLKRDLKSAQAQLDKASSQLSISPVTIKRQEVEAARFARRARAVEMISEIFQGE